MKEYTTAQIDEWIGKFEKGTLTQEEMNALNEWYDLMGNDSAEFKAQEPTLERFKERLYRNITDQLSLTKTVHQSWRRFTVAASILLVCSFSLYLYLVYDHSPGHLRMIAQNEINVAPGKYKAILTLANGEKLFLEEGKPDQVFSGPGVTATKSDRQLIYRITGEAGGLNSMNKIETPAGGQYEVILSDGSSVILNALSSLSFPARFSGFERKVVLTGEGYFNVSKNKTKPFKVSANGQEVEVLGTHFNMNSYTDEEGVVTTLEEGSVRVNAKNGSHIILPGQQAITSVNGKVTIRKANMNEVLAWKNGEMVFEDAELQTIMRQVSRWYNIKIRYEGEVNINRITGSIGRDANLATLLRILKGNGIKIRMEEIAHERTLIITE